MKTEEQKLKKKEYDKMYRERNKQKIYEYNRTPQRVEQLRKSGKKRRENGYFKKYVEENKEKIKEYYSREEIKQREKEYQKQYRENNKNRINEYLKIRKEKNPILKLSHNIRGLIWKSISRNHYKKNTKTNDILGCSFQEFKEHLENQFEPWMNWDNYGKYNGELNYGWDIDHVIPQSSASTEDELLQLNHYSNLKPLCSKVNRDIKRNNPLF